MPKPLALHPDASAYGALRVLKNGTGRFYSVAEGSWRLMEQTLRQARAFGFVTDEATAQASYAVLDVYADWDIVQEFGIPTAQAWRWWKRKLGLRVVEEVPA